MLLFPPHENHADSNIGALRNSAINAPSQYVLLGPAPAKPKVPIYPALVRGQCRHHYNCPRLELPRRLELFPHVQWHRTNRQEFNIPVHELPYADVQQIPRDPSIIPRTLSRPSEMFEPLVMRGYRAVS
jgi:hypothetical protein